MTRPQFTKEEEDLISYIRANDSQPMSTLMIWLPWLLIGGAAFAYGFYHKADEFIFAGFVIPFSLLCRFVYYQVKPSWQMKPIIDKFEEACKNPDNNQNK